MGLSPLPPLLSLLPSLNSHIISQSCASSLMVPIQREAKALGLQGIRFVRPPPLLIRSLPNLIQHSPLAHWLILSGVPEFTSPGPGRSPPGVSQHEPLSPGGLLTTESTVSAQHSWSTSPSQFSHSAVMLFII